MWLQELSDWFLLRLPWDTWYMIWSWKILLLPGSSEDLQDELQRAHMCVEMDCLTLSEGQTKDPTWK